MTKSSLITWIDIPKRSDERGDLIVMEEFKSVPFAIKRVYTLLNMNGRPRGFHAHKALRQVAVCLSGSCRMILDNGAERAEVTLDRPERGILIPEMVWREIHDCSPDCVLMVLANELYDEADYIRDYKEFQKLSSKV